MTPIRLRLRSALIALVVIGCAGVTVAFFVQPGSPRFQARLSDVSLTVAAFLAGVACLVRAFRTESAGRARTSWLLFAGAALGWAFGSSVETVYELGLGREVPQPGLDDLGYELVGPFFAAGLLRLAVPEGNLFARARALVDGLMISTAGLLVVWVVSVGTAVHADTTSTGNKILQFSYPFADAVMATLAIYVVLRIRGDGLKTVLPVEPIALGVLVFGVSDSLYAYGLINDTYQPGGPTDCGWLFAFSLLTVGAMLPGGRPEEAGPRDTLPRRVGLLMPYLFVVVATAASVILPEVTGTEDAVARWIRVALVLLVFLRQFFTLRENEALTRGLEQRVVERTRELEASQQRFRALVENSSDVVSMVDPDGRMLYLSDSVSRVFGVPASHLVGRSVYGALDEASQKLMAEGMASIAGEPLGTTTVELVVLRADGGRMIIESTLTNLLDDPAVQAIVLNARDISERRQLETELVHQAFHDSLTGLANRALFLDRVRHAMQRRTTNVESVGVLFLDLDGFKEVNDSLGHATGDALLVDVARRLTASLRPGDTIARLGGDEFAILVEGATLGEEFSNAAIRIRESLDPAVEIDGRELFIRASIGIASAEVGTVDPDQLIRNADLAMYRAKDRQDGEPAYYDPSMHSTLVERLALEAELRKAIADHQLQVHYQPTYGIDSGDLVGVEALVRWPHPERGMIMPDVFIPLAEQTGLIHELGRFVLRAACFQGQEWAGMSSATPLSIGVNVSGKQLQRRDFADEVNLALLESGLPAEYLVLEMTESILMNDTENTLRTLRALKDMGIRIAIDDFGTGYSSLSYLHRFPVDILKIDRSFVERLSGSDPEDSLVQSIVQLGQTLELETIAEGIEDHTQLLALRRLGCTMAQGYHFGRPGPAEAVSLLVAAAAPARPIPTQAVPAGAPAGQAAGVA